MILKKAHGLSPDLSIAIDGVEVDRRSIYGLELLYEESKHDFALIKMAGLPPDAATEYQNAGVRIVLSTGALYTTTFCGYVTEVHTNSQSAKGLMNNSPLQEATLVCLGASYNMRGSRSKVWNYHSLSDVARSLAARYAFSLETPLYTYSYASISQTDESDWQFLCRYAKQLGYEVNVHGTDMHVYDPYAALSRGVSYNYLNTLLSTRGNPTSRPGQILEFSGDFGERFPDGKYKNTVVTVTTDDNRLYDVTSRDIGAVTNGGPRYSDRIPDHADSYAEAVNAIDQHRKRSAKYDLAASARVTGVANCKPGGVVEVSGFNGEFDGFWYVSSVRHHVHTDAYYSDLSLLRNKDSQLLESGVQGVGTASTPIYTNGAWAAKRRRVKEYT